MPRPRFEKLSAERREAILHAAAEEFAAHGYDGASYNHIIEAAGISKGAAYYYFDDKEDLYLTVVGHVLQDFMEAVPMPDPVVVRTPRQFWDTIDEFTGRVLRYALDHPVVLGLVRSLPRASATATASAALARMNAFGQGFMEQILRTGQAVGAVRTDVPFDLLLRLMLAVDEVADGWLAQQALVMDEAGLQAHGALVVDLMRRLLQPASPEKNRRGAK